MTYPQKTCIKSGLQSRIAKPLIPKLLNGAYAKNDGLKNLAQYAGRPTFLKPEIKGLNIKILKTNTI